MFGTVTMQVSNQQLVLSRADLLFRLFQSLASIPQAVKFCIAFWSSLDKYVQLSFAQSIVEYLETLNTLLLLEYLETV